MMRRVIPFLLVLFLSPPAFSQEFHWGVRGGIPLSKYFGTAINLNRAAGSSTGYVSTTNRYTVGPVVEVGLPFRLGVESGALYKRQHFSRIEFRSTSGPGFPIDISVITETTANAWEFPFLLKFHASDRPVGTFVEVGPSLQVLTHVQQVQTTRSFATPSPPEVIRMSGAAELAWKSQPGFAIGGGIEFRVKTLRVSPGVRSTLWRHKSFFSKSFATFDGLLGSEQDQVEFLMGITF